MSVIPEISKTQLPHPLGRVSILTAGRKEMATCLEHGGAFPVRSGMVVHVGFHRPAHFACYGMNRPKAHTADGRKVSTPDPGLRTHVHAQAVYLNQGFRMPLLPSAGRMSECRPSDFMADPPFTTTDPDFFRGIETGDTKADVAVASRGCHRVM